MALADIKDAGILAEIKLWGWPYHGLCSGGNITLPDSSTKAMTQPSHGAAWLYDMGLPAVVRSTAELLQDAALGHQWLNYGFISGGMVYGTQLGDNSFIYVDPDGVRWLIYMTASTPEISLQRVRLLFNVVRFGLITENGETSTIIANQVDVQCTFIAYTGMAGVSYSSTPIYLEDVWTNGQKALVGVYRAAGAVGDMYSLIELTLSGVGGADGSGVVIDADEIRADSELTYNRSTATAFDPTVSASWPFSDTGSGCARVATWGAYPGVLWNDDTGMIGTLDVLDTERDITASFARVAYYDAAGAPHVYRLVSGYKQHYTFAGSNSTYSGSLTCSGAFCDECESDAHAISSSSILLDIEYGLSVMRDNDVVDSVKFTQSADGAQLFFEYFTIFPATYTGISPAAAEPATPSGYLSTPWGAASSGTYTKQIMRFGAPVLSGSLASSLSITPPTFSGGQAFSYTAPPLSEAAMMSIYSAWRAGTRHYSSGDAVIGDGEAVGVQRIDSKSVAFYKVDSGVRTYGTVHTPAGALSAGMSPSSNLYFAWNRKTGATAFSTSPICYV